MAGVEHLAREIPHSLSESLWPFGGIEYHVDRTLEDSHKVSKIYRLMASCGETFPLPSFAKSF